MNGARPRILIVKPVLPYPPDQGTKVVSFGLIEALYQAYELTLLSRVLERGEEESARRLERWCARVIAVHPPNCRSIFHRAAYRVLYNARSLATGRSLKSLYDCPGAFVRAARRLSGETFDLVIIEYWQLYPLFDVFEPAKVVLLTHDIDLLVHRGQAGVERGRLRRSAAARRRRLEEREEVRAYRRARTVLALTQRDADAVKSLSRGRARVEVLPFGLDASSFERDPAARNSREVLFLGAMGAVFNRDALEFFVRDIHPHLAMIDGVRFTVLGGALPPSLAFFGHFRNVEVVGHVRDTRSYLVRAACLVVPLRFGGGLRVRILEAMAAGLPVVCSPVAIEGMGFEAGRHYLRAQTAPEYRDQVRRLLDDPLSALRLARSARDRVWEVYGPDARGPRTRALVERLRALAGGEGAGGEGER